MMMKTMNVTMSAAVFLISAAAFAQQPISKCSTVISTPGSYALSGDLKCTANSENAITIQNVDGVTLNLNGHAIHGTVKPNGNGGITNTAITISNAKNVTVIGNASTIDQFEKAFVIDKSTAVRVVGTANKVLNANTESMAVTITTCTDVLVDSLSSLAPRDMAVSAFNSQQISLSNITINSPSNPNNIITSSGLYFSVVSDSTVSNVNIYHVVKGIELQNGGSNVTLTNIAVKGQSTWGLQVAWTTNYKLINISVESGDMGFMIGGNNKNLLVMDSSFKGNIPQNALCNIYPPNSPADISLINTSPAVLRIPPCKQ